MPESPAKSRCLSHLPQPARTSGEKKPALNGGLFLFLLLCTLLPWGEAEGSNRPPAQVVVASYNVENYTLCEQPRSRPKPEDARDAVADTAADVRPDVLGLCEIGSREALEDLRRRLKARGFDLPFAEYVDGPDPDRHLALLSRFPITSRQSVPNVPYVLGGNPERVRRGFLDVTVQITAGYSLRLVGVHLKSRLPAPGGEALLRRMEAQLLRQHIDGVLERDPDVNLLVYGDLNDTKEESTVRCVQGPRGGLGSLTDLPAVDAGGDRWTYYRYFTDVYERIDYLMVNRALRPEIVSGSARIGQAPQWRRASDHRILCTSLIPVDR